MNKYTFICNAFKDALQCEANLPTLRVAYPNERVVIILDGDRDPVYYRLAAKYSCELVEGEHLYALHCGSQITQRMIDVFLKKPTDFLVKFDTDTRFFRPFSMEPAGFASGCIWGGYGFRYLQGGCRIFSKQCAEQLDQSGILKGDRYKDITSWCPFTVEELYKGWNLVSDDFIVRDALLSLGIQILDYPEIFSAGIVKRWRLMDPKTLRLVLNKDASFAVTHPWKLADIKWALAVRPLLLDSASWHDLGTSA